ncbi:MAG: GNAT family N-acetyltransferase [Phycisphaeraceae bacterium]|nr:GNAT family N-acetyltransferase [Phycisphaeraceae bacterium]
MPIVATTIETERLTLVIPARGDALSIAAICEAPDVSANTLTLPHPYTEADAHDFVDRVEAGMEAGNRVTFLIRRRADGAGVGTIGLVLEPPHHRAELGYIIRLSERGQGYATEACRGVLAYGFGELGLHKITAAWFTDNPASGRILEKLGFHEEGRLREHFFRGGRWRDTVSVGLLRQEFERQQRSADAGENER